MQPASAQAPRQVGPRQVSRRAGLTQRRAGQGTIEPQLLAQLNVAEAQDLSPMQESQASAAALTLGSFAAFVRQRLSQPSTSYELS